MLFLVELLEALDRMSDITKLHYVLLFNLLDARDFLLFKVKNSLEFFSSKICL